MKTYMFAWNGRKKYIDAFDINEARRMFMETYGFFPENVEITEV